MTERGGSRPALFGEWEINSITEEAVSIAKASASVKRDKDVQLAPVEPVVDKWESQFRIDPFEVKAEDKISLLLEADSLMRKNQQVRIASGNIWCMKEDKIFASTEGSYIEQVKTETGGVLKLRPQMVGNATTFISQFCRWRLCIIRLRADFGYEPFGPCGKDRI